MTKIDQFLEPAYIANILVHKGSKLSREKFLDRVSCVKAIRHRVEDFKLSYYPTSIDHWSLWKGLYDAVNEGNFDGVDVYESKRTFVLILPRRAYDLFWRVDLGVIQNQIICFLSFLWEMDASMRHVMREQVYPPVLEKAINLAKCLFPSGIEQSKDVDELRNIYINTVENQTGIPPLDFLLLPAESDEKIESKYGMWNKFCLSYATCYFNELDWESVIDKGLKDDLHRSESLSEPWEMWKHDFQLGDRAQNGEVKIFEEIPASGIVYLIHQCGSCLYKIGWSASSDPENRLTSLQTGNPNVLTVAGYFKVSSIKAFSAGVNCVSSS